MASKEHSNEQHCPQCGNHCPVDALQCGKGHRYFGIDSEKKHDRARPEGSLSLLLRQCGRFVHHGGKDLEEQELFQGLADEEQASLRALLEKLSAGWQQRFGEDCLRHKHGGKDHHKHGGGGKGKHHHKHEGHDR